MDDRKFKRGGVLLGANRKDNQQINFRVSEVEYERLSAMAKELNMSVPTFCKKKAQGARIRYPKINKESGLEIARELRAIGNNVNQLTKRANKGNEVSAEELKEVQKELQGIWQRFS